MSSAVSAAIPADDVKVDKADLRANFATIKAEISALQRKFTTGFDAFQGFISRTETTVLIEQEVKRTTHARDMACGVISFDLTNN